MKVFALVTAVTLNLATCGPLSTKLSKDIEGSDDEHAGDGQTDSGQTLKSGAIVAEPLVDLLGSIHFIAHKRQIECRPLRSQFDAVPKPLSGEFGHIYHTKLPTESLDQESLEVCVDVDVSAPLTGDHVVTAKDKNFFYLVNGTKVSTDSDIEVYPNNVTIQEDVFFYEGTPFKDLSLDSAFVSARVGDSVFFGDNQSMYGNGYEPLEEKLDISNRILLKGGYLKLGGSLYFFDKKADDEKFVKVIEADQQLTLATDEACHVCDQLYMYGNDLVFGGRMLGRSVSQLKVSGDSSEPYRSVIRFETPSSYHSGVLVLNGTEDNWLETMSSLKTHKTIPHVKDGVFFDVNGKLRVLNVGTDIEIAAINNLKLLYMFDFRRMKKSDQQVAVFRNADVLYLNDKPVVGLSLKDGDQVLEVFPAKYPEIGLILRMKRPTIDSRVHRIVLQQGEKQYQIEEE